MRKIIVGISGGVDSAVAAYLLLQQGYQVEGLFMKNWEDDDKAGHCAAEQDFQDAKQVCDKLGIPLHVRNFAQTYWDKVFEYFLEEYNAGRTPNPDVLCNKEVKFKAFLEHALDNMSADAIATGHYARISQDEQSFHLQKGLDENKDQSYFLCALNQYQLSKSLFPLGELKKSDVRGIAEAQGFSNHAKKDSTGICFIGERRFSTFLKEYLLTKPGKIVTTEGDIIGEHDGLMYYTIGQRGGLGIGGSAKHEQAPWFVCAKELDQNVLVVCQGTNNSALYAQKLSAKPAHWITQPPVEQAFQCEAKIRYRQQPELCHVSVVNDDELQVTFEQPQRAVTPGQYLVLYRGDRCFGSAIIQ